VTVVAAYDRISVNISPSALYAHARSDAGRRAIRYMATSGIGVALTQLLLGLFLHVFHWRSGVSNVVAVSLVSVPAFLLNKYWVWGKRGRAHMRREVLPFWAFTIAGLALHVGGGAGGQRHQDPTVPGWNGNKTLCRANIMGFGVLWVLKYLFLDKIMFGAHHHTPYDEDIEAEEALTEGLPAPVDG
jgi:putative flippase GtrA